MIPDFDEENEDKSPIDPSGIILWWIRMMQIIGILSIVFGLFLLFTS